jgi:glutamine---fructose-6-phosphate transaminase (isomerizing)
MDRTNVGGQEPATLREILSQAQAWRDSLRAFKASQVLRAIVAKAGDSTEWIFVGCGTSLYLAEAAAASWNILTGQPVRAIPASEILLFPALNLPRDSNVRAILISRSGSTSETVRAAKLLRTEHRIPTIGVTCTPNSLLESACEVTIQLTAADESSMVMTRSFTSMLLVLQYLAATKAGNSEYCGTLETLADQFAPSIKSFSERMAAFTASHNFDDYIFLGQGPFQGIVREASLKLTEMSCSYSQQYHTLEFRHGPKTIVSARTLLTFFISEAGSEAECEMLAEMKQLGGIIMAVCNRSNDIIRASSDQVFELNLDVPELALLAPAVVPAQLLGCYTGMKKGLSPDAPKNLSRVVLLD